ncbi:MAG: DEAD/DEAH box helicase [Planctomycetes bacterium]|nr:DEAD/DEAH box helicase [Planctomycetota bacterium]
MSDMPVLLGYDRGTVTVTGGPPGFVFSTLPGVIFDPRTSAHRAQGRFYRAIVEQLIKEKIKYEDTARGWPNEPAGWKINAERTARDYQTAAVNDWLKCGRRGVVVMPTGTGKTFMSFLCIEKVGRPTLVVTPKIDLMVQWARELEQSFGVEVGMVGAGEFNYKPLTVTTYDSAYIHLERWANRYGLVIFDECHHLPGATFSESANASLAPFRLGLTATPERADGGEMMFPQLIGPIAFRLDINDAGDHLAPYETRRIYVDLTAEEAETYKSCREEYKRFAADRGINMSGMDGFRRFLFEASKTAEGWSAMKAFREQKRIVQSASGKFKALEKLLAQHAADRSLIFTADNATVYEIARRYLIPAMTNQTKPKERKSILAKFHAGDYNAVVTCQVLNEGVDVPSAGVGIVMGGTGSATENVQRLGRILRKHNDKQAVLYEIIAKNTAEEFVSDRRRQHRAFQ